MDHGFNVDLNKRCKSTTKKDQPCSLPALMGIDMCALHSGLARAKGKPGYGDARLLDNYKRGLGQPKTPQPQARAGGMSRDAGRPAPARR